MNVSAGAPGDGRRGDAFLTLAERGRNGLWRYLLGIAAIAAVWIGLTAAFGVALGAAIDLMGLRPGRSGSLLGLGPLVDYTVVNLTFLPLLLGLFVVVRYVHRRPFRTLATGGERVDWRLAIRSALVYFGLLAALTSVQYLAMPDAFRFDPDPAAFALLLSLALVLTPIQASTEELLMRGYVMQALRRLTARRWIVVAVSSALFALLHVGNPEAQEAPWLALAYYAGFGVILALVTLKAERLEPAMGIHTANNLFTVLLVNPEVSALPSPSVLTYTGSLGAIDLAILAAAGALVYRAMPLTRRGNS